jgi:predicted dehydrogenase
MKAGLIGCGKIAHFHADVLQHLGIEIVAAAYRSNLENAKAFQVKYGIPTIYSDWRSMIDNENPDAVWVLADWESIDQMLIPIVAMDLPAFFEKPVALSSSAISDAIAAFPGEISKIQVGYNRRFYDVVKILRNELGSRAILCVEVMIPESVNLSDKKMVHYRTLQNSSHLFDLLIYLLDDNLRVNKYVHKFADHAKSTPGFISLFETHGKIPVYVSSVFNSPVNSSIRICTDDEFMFELKPLEKLTIFKGFSVSEPTADQPIRLYNPKIIKEYYEPVGKFKPGFLSQAEAFLNFTYQGNNKSFPNLQSSLIVTSVIESIINQPEK